MSVRRLSRARQKNKEYATVKLVVIAVAVILVSAMSLVVHNAARNLLVNQLDPYEDEYDIQDVTDAPHAQTSPNDGIWQPVAGTKYRFFVYSAYVDDRLKHSRAVIRIIGVTKTMPLNQRADDVMCRLWLPNRTLTLAADVETMEENWGLKYSAVFVHCRLPKTVQPNSTVGATISVLVAEDAYRNTSLSNMLVVQDITPKAGIEHTLHACIQPFHSNFESRWLVEWVEFNRLLGVTHFHMYNKSMTSKTECIVQHYLREGVVSLRQWTGLDVNSMQLKNEGQIAALNDCLFHAMSRAGWIFVLDTDELVVPRRASTLLDLINKMGDLYKDKQVPASLMFRNAFFFTFWKNDSSAQFSLLTSLKTQRQAEPTSIDERTKYIVKPTLATSLGTHFVCQSLQYPRDWNVPVDDGLLHHYRDKMVEEGIQKVLVDRSAHKYSAELMKRVDAETAQLQKTCPQYFIN